MTTTREPKYIRPAQAPWYGVSRSTAYNWINDGILKSTLIRRPGNKHGVRLISVEALKALIERSPAK